MIPRVEFGPESCPPPTAPGFFDRAAFFNNGRSLKNPLVYIVALFLHPCIAKSRADDLRLSPWEQFPLSCRDVEKWMLGDDRIRPLVNKFKATIGPVNGAALRGYNSESKEVGLFQNSAMERMYIKHMLDNIELMLHHEAELMSPLLLTVATITKRHVLKPFSKSSLPLQTNGTEQQKNAVAKSINSHLNNFLVSMEKALRRRFHGPLNDWAMLTGGSMGLFDMSVVANLVWLTGGCTTSLRLALPKLKQWCFDNAVTARNAL
jgi:hypothetical protein